MSVAAVAQSSSQQSETQQRTSSATSSSASGAMGSAQLMGMDYDAGAAALTPGNTDYLSQAAALSPVQMSAGGAMSAMGGDEQQAPEPATLADVMGGAYEGDRDFFVGAYWESRCAIDPLLDEVRGVDAGAATQIDGHVVDSEAVLDEIGEYEARLLESARWEGDTLVYDEGLAADLASVLLDVDTYGRLLQAHATLWGLVMALPWIDGFAVLLAGWVQILENLDAVARIAMSSYTLAKEIYDAHKKEFDEACHKVGVDAALLGAGLLGAAVLSGPLGIGAGVAIGMTGVISTLAIEGRLGTLGQLKTGLNGANIGRAVAEASSEGITGLSADLTKGLKGLGPALNVLSLVADSAEAAIEKGVVEKALAQMRDLDARYGDVMAIWPSAAAALEVAGPQLERLELAIADIEPRMDSLQAEIAQLTGQLGAG